MEPLEKKEHRLVYILLFLIKNNPTYGQSEKFMAHLCQDVTILELFHDRNLVELS
jgi:hypothetical protein